MPVPGQSGPPTPRPDASASSFASRVLIAVGITVAVVLLLWLLGRALHVFLVLFAAILFAVLLTNLSNYISRFTRLPYKWALLTVILLFFGTIIGGMYLLAPSLMKQGQELTQSLPKAIENLKQKLPGLPFGEQIMEGLPDADSLLKADSGTLKQVMGIFSTTLGSLVNILIIIIIGIYLAASPNSMAEGVIKLVPISRRDRAREVLYTIGVTLWGWMKGTLLAMLLIGTVTTIGLMLLGIPMALILGITAGLFEFVPNIGPFIAGAPAVLFALLDSPSKALWVIGLFVAVQSLEGWVLTPLLQKKVIDLPPVLTIAAQLLLGMLTGLLGLILAVPLMGVLMVLVKMLYIEDVLGDRTLEIKGEEEAHRKIERSQQEAEEEKE